MGISRDYAFSENKNNIKSGALVELSLPSQINLIHKDLT